MDATMLAKVRCSARGEIARICVGERPIRMSALLLTAGNASVGGRARYRIAALNATMCAGVVPQHPPTIAAWRASTTSAGARLAGSRG
jgi:hypothetical protein